MMNKPYCLKMVDNRAFFIVWVVVISESKTDW